MFSSTRRNWSGPLIFCLCLAIGLAPKPIPSPTTQVLQDVGLEEFSTAAAAPTHLPSESEQQLEELGCWGGEESERFGPIDIPGGLIVQTRCGTIHAQNTNGDTAWIVDTGAPLNDAPEFVGGELIVIGADLHLKGIDPRTGAVNWQEDSNGRASYVQIERVRRKDYALLSDMSGYDKGYQTCLLSDRENTDACDRTEPDKLALMSKNEVVRVIDVPAWSEIAVRNGRVFLVSSSATGQKRLRRVRW